MNTKKIWVTCKLNPLYSISNYGEVKNNKTNKTLKGWWQTSYSRYVDLAGVGLMLVDYLVSEHFNKHQIHQDSAMPDYTRAVLPRLQPSTRRQRQSYNMKRTWAKRNKKRGRKLIGVYSYNRPNSNQKYRAVIKWQGKIKTIGYYYKRKEAQKAYLEFCKTNNIEVL